MYSQPNIELYPLNIFTKIKQEFRKKISEEDNFLNKIQSWIKNNVSIY